LFFPEDIQKLHGLKELFIHSNDIQTIPVELTQVTALKQLTIEGNPIKSMPKKVISGKADVIFDYLKRVEAFESEKEGKKEEIK